jgi:shikimate dehydrogenase
MNTPRSQMPHTAHQTLHLGLIGYPLGHSLSPLLHQTALYACGLAGEYRLYPVRPFPDCAPELERLLARMRTGEIHGLNVTIPYKQSVLRYLDELTPAGSAIGAVNTIYMVDSRLVGDNTDAPAFMTDLYKKMGRSGSSRSAIILGAGGSARAVAFALLGNGWQVTVAARRLSQARELVESFPPHASGLYESAELQAIQLSQFSLRDTGSRFSFLDAPTLLIVNTTPAGMTPHTDACSWPVDLPIPRDAFVYDLVYNPPETKLMQIARSQGIPATSGLGMLVEQAALAFEIWTGYPASRAAMHAAVSARNESNSGTNNG